MAAVQVVPMPRVWGCTLTSARIARLAVRTASPRASWGWAETSPPASINLCLMDSAAMRAATSPAAAPPIPSHTRSKKPLSGRGIATSAQGLLTFPEVRSAITKVSSLSVRSRPTSVAPQIRKIAGKIGGKVAGMSLLGCGPLREGS